MSIKKLQNNFTTPEQSKRLLELGVPADSADCYRRMSERSLSRLYERWTDAELHKKFFTHIPDVTPCWSAGRLMEIYTNCYQPDNDLEESLTFTRNQDYIDVLMKVYEEGVKYGDLDFSKLEE